MPNPNPTPTIDSSRDPRTVTLVAGLIGLIGAATYFLFG
jgi:hypothetical protein